MCYVGHTIVQKRRVISFYAVVFVCNINEGAEDTFKKKEFVKVLETEEMALYSSVTYSSNFFANLASPTNHGPGKL